MAPTRVLLLEDTPPDARVISDILMESRAGQFALTHVDTLAAAIERAGRDDFDVVLLDLCVHDSEGLATFASFHQAAPHLPVIVQSGIDEEGVAVEAVRLGAQDYLVKEDIDPRTLPRAIRYAMERMRIESSLRESEQRFALAVQGANDGVWDWDVVRNVIFFSDRWKSMLGCAPDAIGDRPEDWFVRVHPFDRDSLAAAIKRHLDGGSNHLEHEYRIRHRDGAYRWVLCRGLAVRDDQGRATRIAGSQSDVTKRKAVEERLVHDAFHDVLTGLPNRALFLDRLDHALLRVRRFPRQVFAVLFLDLDRFKVINDSLGHLVGDQLLVEVARRLRDCLRPCDTVARLGGDEFVILLEDLHDLSEAVVVAERIQATLRQPVTVGGKQVFTSTSIGIVQGENSYTRPEVLLRDADAAMYRAKNDGRARYAIFDQALHSSALARLEMETDLRRAVERGEFVLCYQPIVSLRDGATVCFEALLRWESPHRGTVSPDEFVPLLEETGLILPVGSWVVRESCRQMREWIDCFQLDPSGLTVSVNVSSRQFAQPGLVDEIVDVLEEQRLPASCLILEITETVLMEQPDAAVETLSQLRRLGVGIDVDDFGTGYSSLSYLQRFPIDRLKIDRSFVSGMAQRNGDLEIVRAVLSLARSLGISVVAEGIETPDQLNRLKLMNCDYGQGFLFSRPIADCREHLVALAQAC